MSVSSGYSSGLVGAKSAPSAEEAGKKETEVLIKEIKKHQVKRASLIALAVVCGVIAFAVLCFSLVVLFNPPVMVMVIAKVAVALSMRGVDAVLLLALSSMFGGMLIAAGAFLSNRCVGEQEHCIERYERRLAVLEDRWY